MVGIVGSIADSMRGRTDKVSSILIAERRLLSSGCQRMGRVEVFPGVMGNSKRSSPVMVKENVG